MAGFWAISAGAASGLLAFLAFPPVDSGALAFVALVPLFIVFRRAEPKGVVLGSSAFGLVFFGALIAWIRLFGFPAYLGLVALQTFWVVITLVSGSTVARRLRDGWAVVIFPLAFLAGEYLRSRFPFGGFTWGGLGYSQHDNIELLRLAAYTGVWGLSLLVAATNAMVGEALLALRHTTRYSLGLVGVTAALIGLPGLMGGHIKQGRPATIAMVQGNVPEDNSDPNADDLTVLRNHLRLTGMLKRQNPSLVVWPESSLDRDPFKNPAFGEPLRQAIRATGAPFLVGATLEAEEHKAADRYNASLFFSSDSSLSGVYAKQHLVPFGEWVPFRPVLEPLIRQLERVPFDTVPGRSSVVFRLPEGKFASVICYESTFPDLVRSFVRKGARLLVVSTNNSSFERTAASEQHVAFSQVRAAEHRMWVAHTALSGISAVVDPSGRVVGRTGLFEPALLVPTVRFASGMTPYARMGDWVPLGAGALFAALALSRLKWPFGPGKPGTVSK